MTRRCVRTDHALFIAAAVLASECSAAHRGPASIRAIASGADRLEPVRDGAPPNPSSDELVREALVGVRAGPETTLDARVQVRALHIPHPGRGANARFNFDGGRRGWITAMPGDGLLTTPAFARGKIYTGGGFSSHDFYALDAYTGALAWTVAAPDGGPSSAIIKDDDVIFNTESCTLFVFNADTGQERWHRWLGDPLMSQPAAADGVIFSPYPVSGHHEFGAFLVQDGTPTWHDAIPADVIQAPQVHGDSVYFATMDGTAFRVERANGHVVWSRDIGAASALWVDGDNVLLSRRIDVNQHATEQLVVLSARDGSTHAEGDRFDAPYFTQATRDRQLARQQNGAWGVVPHGDHLGLANVAAGWAFQGSSPSVADGRAYFAIGGEIRAREIATGRTVWHRTYAAAADAQAVSPPAVVNGQLVFGTVDGHVYAVDIDTGMTVWAYDVGEPVMFQPIVAQGWVYFATGRGNVVGLEIGDPAFDGWHMWGGNAEHAGLVESAGTVDPHLLASLERPTQGTMRRARFEESSDATPAPSETPSPTSPPQEPEQPDLPLAHTDVQATVAGTVARVTVTQQFQNPYDRPIEAVYLFPLPDDAAVDAMEMHIGARVVRARIQQREQAQQTYTQARASGHRAALLEQQRPNLFAQRVANIQPGERIDVQIQYAERVPFRDGEYEFVYPMVAPRRFDPAHPDPRAPHVDALASGSPTPSIAAAGNDLRDARSIGLAIAVDAGLPIEHIDSPTHTVVIDRTAPGAASVRLAPSDTIANRDFVLRYTTSGPAPRATVLGDHGYFSLLVQPPASPARDTIAHRNVVFLVDTSSSMRGQPLAQAEAVLDRVLDGIRPDDHFDVLSFADRIDALSPTPLAGTAENVARARQHITTLRATGSTDMLAAIRAALEASHGGDPHDVPILVLVTDGYIANEADVLRAIAENLGPTRVFTLGVGSSVNRFLIDRAAEIGRGRATVTTLSEAPLAVADRFAREIQSPVFTDVAIDWGGLDVQDVYPRHIPDLFASEPLVVSGRYTRGGHARVRVRGTIGGERFERAVDVDLTQPASTQFPGTQRTLWARDAVHDRMNDLALHDDPAIIAEVTQLGLAHHIVTPYTSFVAVDEEPARAAHGDVQQIASNEQAVISPGRALPGDPEIRIPAPEDARAVTVVLPFGETVAASWDSELGLWVARFLIPRDDSEGGHTVRVLITLADGSEVRRTVGYTVDSVAPRVNLELVGVARAGGEAIVRATQVITQDDLALDGFARNAARSPERIALLADTRRVELRTPSGDVIEMAQTGRGAWEAHVPIPHDATSALTLDVFAIDLAANVGHQSLTIPVAP